VATKQSDWRPCDVPPPLPEGTVHVWYAGLDVDEATFARLTAVTSVDERDRARRVRVPSAGRRFLVARAILRMLLGAYLDAPPAALPLPAGRSEKPRLLGPEESELRFNLSHSGDTVLLAFARRLEVGVDIECEVEGRAPERLVRRFCSDAERRLLEGLDGHARSAAALVMWTRKEALAKAWGRGVYRSNLRELDLGLGADEGWLTVFDAVSSQSWSVRTIRPPDGACAAAVAVQDGGAAVECFRWVARPGPA
jgi:4'-phosphopantetheinyl transferase